MNNDDKIFQHDEIRNASRMRERNEKNKRMLRKTNYEVEKNDKKFEKNDRENKKHD